MPQKYDAIKPSPGYIAARVVERKRPEQLVEVDVNNPESWVGILPLFIAALTKTRDDTAIICEVLTSRAGEDMQDGDRAVAGLDYQTGDLIVLKEYTGAKFAFENDTIMCRPRDVAGKLDLETGAQVPS